MSAPLEPVELVVVDVAAWREWLRQNHSTSPGVWLVLAKKGTVEPTDLSYDQALDEALCYGWIDGRLQGRDGATFRRRFTPRSRRSAWSRRNVEIATRLSTDGRMHSSGAAEVERAKADGRWEHAYASQSSMGIPTDLAAALAVEPRAQAAFETLSRQNRYAILYRIETAKRQDTRNRRIEQFVAMLARGETIHPQR
jgi:uncharacterized protein YdeI (YjbR/CyaY-like superfamily)